MGEVGGANRGGGLRGYRDLQSGSGLRHERDYESFQITLGVPSYECSPARLP